MSTILIDSTNRRIANVSVIIPCYRSANTIERAVESIWNQTHLPRELILVEDFSNDGQLTVDMLKKIKNKYPDNWVRNIFLDSNHGPGYARNTGWEKANGKYIAFLDADDSWHPKKIEIQYEYMEREEGVDISGHKHMINNYLNRENISDKPIDIKQVELKDMFISNRFYTRTIMLKADIKNRFDNKMYCAEDFLLWCEILASGYRGVVLNINMAYVYDNDGPSLSSNLFEMEIGELLAYKRLREKRIISQSRYYVCCAFSYLKYIRRKAKQLTTKKINI